MPGLLWLQHRGQDDPDWGEPGPGGHHQREGEDHQQHPDGRGHRDAGLRDRGQHPGGRGQGGGEVQCQDVSPGPGPEPGHRGPAGLTTSVGQGQDDGGVMRKTINKRKMLTFLISVCFRLNSLYLHILKLQDESLN